ncbi:MAG: DMT family transporter [bacterium]|nr:DMT family transporter [Acidimicrobiia bacterium]MCY4649560.1 DMT family transporter [bacterium]
MSAAAVVLFGLLGGVVAAVQSQMMGQFEQRVGMMAGTAANFIVGAVVMVVILLAIRGPTLAEWGEVPPYLFLAGVTGIVIISSIAFTVSRVGVLAGSMLLVTAQLTGGTIIDHFGWFGASVREVSLTKLLGIMFLILGARLVLR